MASGPGKESAEPTQRRGRKRSFAYSEAALELPSIADQTADRATKQYDGIIVECENLGVLAPGQTGDTDTDYIQSPLRWPAACDGVRADRRKVYAKWTISLVADRSVKTTVVTSARLDNVLSRQRSPEPTGMANFRAMELPSIAMHQSTRR